MKFHENCLRDRRSRIYIPVKAIICNNGVINAERLVGNQEYQAVIHYLPPETDFVPGSSILLDFGQAICGGIRFNNFGDAGRLRIKFGESVSEALGNSNQECSRKDTILDTPHSGMLDYGNTVFRFVRLENAGDTTIHCQHIMGIASECDLEVTGAFESSDERLNRIWKTAVRTVHLCMQEYIYDGAKRDRIVWMGDMHPEIKGICCAFSDLSIIRDSFEFLIRQAPADMPMNQIYTYSCWFIISVWDYYMASGDKEFLLRHAEYFRTMLEKYSSFVNPDGSECVPERRFLDWPNNDNLQAKHAGIQALLYWMHSTGEKIMAELQMDHSASTLAKTALARHIPDPSGRKAPAALLTITGLADRRDVLENDPFMGVSTFYGYYMLLAKDTIPALELIRRYWGAMLDMGATSFWEDFDLNWTDNAFGIDQLPVPGKKDIHADFGKYCYVGLRHSLSHGWSCGPAPFLSERVLGVKFLAPGGSKVSIRPDTGDLEYVSGSVPTAHGTIRITAERGRKVAIDAPAGIEVIH
ncbi:MAG: alpha-L-rhamnosidase [Lentisphaeria bacterium]|nr:alpha-L-rhamnosidase [Lentisphaeria bacterium]